MATESAWFGRGLMVAGWGILAVGSLTAGEALAQAKKAGTGLQEIIVTTTKREEALQKVPLSVSVVTGDVVSEFGLQGFEEVQNHVPNLIIQETLGSYQIRMRGLGSGNGQLSFVSAVGIFVDGVYCGRPRCFQNPLFDIERIEVVRGPQGALFGKNTIAGAVSTITAGPTADVEGQVSAGVELAEGGYNVSGIWSGPVSDTLGVRLAGQYEDLDGYIHNTSTGKDENAVESKLFRTVLEWKPLETLRVRLKGELGERDYDGYTAQLIGLGGYGTPIPFSQPESINKQTSTNTIFPDGQWDNTDSDSFTLQADWNIGDFTLTSITGAVGFDFERRVTATAYKQLFLDTNIAEDYEQYSQELRLVSPTGKLFDYVVGVYFSKDDDRIMQQSPFAFPPFVPWEPTDPDTKVYTGGRRVYRGNGDTTSAYGSGTFHFLDDRARVTLGLRAGQEDLEGHTTGFNWTYDRATDTFTRLPDFGGIPPFAAYKVFSIYGKRDESYLLPSLNLQYDFTDDIMAYASYAEGFKAGGFMATDSTIGSNVRAQVDNTTTGGVSSWAMTYAGMPTITDQQLIDGIWLKKNNGITDYKPEKSDSFEIGAKTRFFDGTLQWNVALYYTDFQDLQTAQYDGTRMIVRNAAEATSKGLESELQWQASDNLSLGLSVAYNKAKFDKYKNTFCKVISKEGTLAVPGCVDGFGDLSGETMERAPEWTGTASFDWDSPLTAGTRLKVNGSLYYSDDYYLHQSISPLYVQDAFTKVDLRVAVTDAADRWEVALIGRNLGDELTMQHAYRVGQFSAASVSTPRYVTLQGTWKFR